MSYISEKLDKIFLLMQGILTKNFDNNIKTNSYYQAHKEEIDILYNKLCIDNIYNLVSMYMVTKTNPDFTADRVFFLGNYSYSRNNDMKESFRMMFPYLSGHTFQENIQMIDNLGFHIEKEHKKQLFTYMEKNPYVYYNLGFAFGKDVKLGLKVFLNCSIEEIYHEFPEIYEKLFCEFPKLHPEEYKEKTLFGIDFNKDGSLNNFKIYSSQEFIKAKILDTIPEEYSNLINHTNNKYRLKYVIRSDENGNTSYKLNMKNINDIEAQTIIENYFPNIKDKLPVKILGISFAKNESYHINKVDCYITY